MTLNSYAPGAALLENVSTDYPLGFEKTYALSLAEGTELVAQDSTDIGVTFFATRFMKADEAQTVDDFRLDGDMESFSLGYYDNDLGDFVWSETEWNGACNAATALGAALLLAVAF